ncbi:MAG: hypothetical protein WCO84_08635 [bacterium]
MKIYRYEDSLAEIVNSPVPTCFLAGPTVRGNQPHLISWRFDAIREFEKQGFDGSLIIPEFTSKTESDKGKRWIPKWEFAGLSGCDIIMFWIPRTKELIGLTTNHEHGYWLGKLSHKMVYGRPEESYRNTYLDEMWEIDAYQNYRFPMPIHKTLEATVDAVINKTITSEFLLVNREKSKIFVASPYGAF